MNHSDEKDALARVLQKMANGVDERIVVTVGEHRGRLQFHMTDPWGGDFWEENWRKVRDFLWSGY